MPTGKGISWDSPASETIEGAPADKPLWQYAQENGIGKTATVMGVSWSTVNNAIKARNGGSSAKPGTKRTKLQADTKPAAATPAPLSRGELDGWEARGAA